MATDLEKVKEVFGFLLAQELAKSAPKDTGHLARTFLATYQNTTEGFKYTLPEYAKYIIHGTYDKSVGGKGIAPNFFIQNTVRLKSKQLLKQAFRTASK